MVSRSTYLSRQQQAWNCSVERAGEKRRDRVSVESLSNEQDKCTESQTIELRPEIKRFESESKANKKRGLPVVEDMQTAELSVAFAEHEEEGITEVDEFGH